MLIEAKKGYENIRTLVAMAAEHDMFVRLDMEDHVTTATIDIVRSLHKEGLTNVGTVLQGRLFGPSLTSMRWKRTWMKTLTIASADLS